MKIELMNQALGSIAAISLVQHVNALTPPLRKFGGTGGALISLIGKNFLAITATLALVAVTTFFFYKNEDKNLVRACMDKKEAITKVKSALNRGADVDYKLSRNGNTTALIQAAHRGMEDVVDLLIKQGATIDLQDDVNGTALMIASQTGHLECVRALLAAGADPNVKRSRDMCHALHLAAGGGHGDICQLLIDKGCDVGWASKVGMTALMYTVRGAGKPQVGAAAAVDTSAASESENVQGEDGDASTTEKSSDWEKEETKRRTTADCYAHTISILHRAGADMDAVNARGWTALIVAARSSTTAVLEQLLKLGASSTKTTTSGLSALIAACAGPSPSAVRALLTSGATQDPPQLESDSDISKKTKGTSTSVDGQKVARQATPLFSVCRATFIAEQLHQARARGKLVGGGGFLGSSDGGSSPDIDTDMSALHDRQVETAELLLKDSAAHVNRHHDGGNTPLLAAANGGNPGLVRLLLKHGADVHAARDDGWTPLLAAVDGGAHDVVAALLEAGADATVHAAAPKRWGPLHAAVAQGNEALVAMLLEAGAPVDGFPADDVVQHDHDSTADKGARRVGVKGKDAAATEETKAPSPLHMAAYEGLVDVCRILLDAGANLEGLDPLGNTPLLAAVRGAEIPRPTRDVVADSSDATGSEEESLRDSVVVVTLLVDRGADLQAQNDEGFNAAAIAAIIGKHTLLRRLLSAPGAALPSGDLSWKLRFAIAMARAMCMTMPKLSTTAHRAGGSGAIPTTSESDNKRKSDSEGDVAETPPPAAASSERGG